MHHHHVAVTLPDGAEVWAASLREDYTIEPRPDFAICLDARWQPPWPHCHVDWPDFGVPDDREALLGVLAEALRRAHGGEVVEIGCFGGHGRTGTAIACLAVLAGVDSDPVEWVRTHYCSHAVETDSQMAFVRTFYNEESTS
jgi:protein-tyrosine phosphatase